MHPDIFVTSGRIVLLFKTYFPELCNPVVHYLCYLCTI